jgi:hypothetical protein
LKPTVNYSVHKSPPMDPILSQINPFRTLSLTRDTYTFRYLYVACPESNASWRQVQSGICHIWYRVPKFCYRIISFKRK